ncbi:hypothetical protein BVJ60_17785 [Vibrio cholerae]|uniref:hypothetical protein n=1 Tax=Vibrio cholerae TaxID=666 RepID=UPI00096BC91E|nr:hypothetical protein [Vibrio cholerae]EKF9373098.1 hypothetical protein [Vibrio cholerae]MBO1386602.1 hypothetical protein [Vibrio cholerae]WOQ91461.1 hypothetical protein R4535_17090 [Vibrio cholerae]
MILMDKKTSSLVKLSDCSKFAMISCIETSEQYLEIASKHVSTNKKLQTYAKEVESGALGYEELEVKIKELTGDEYTKDAIQAVALQGKLNSECMLFIVNCCFALESYINTLAHYLLDTKNLANVKSDTDNDVLPFFMEAFDKQSTVAKWEFIGKLKGSKFDKSKPPFQDLKVLFSFRNDMAHDKVNDFNVDVPKKYNNKLPNFMSNLLSLEHALFAAQTFQDLVKELKVLLGDVIDEFQKHYNLSPWFNDEVEKQAKSVVKQLKSVQ